LVGSLRRCFVGDLGRRRRRNRKECTMIALTFISIISYALGLAVHYYGQRPVMPRRHFGL
jgi:hypothetical protein